MRNIIVSALFFAFINAANSFEVEEDDFGKSTQVGMTQVIELKGQFYAFSPVPTIASQFKSSPDTSPYPEFAGKLFLGDPMTKEEALKVIEAYYRHNAIDFKSIVIRKFALGERQYVFWCSNPSALGCLNREGRAGNWVEFEVNGANRSGGMTGFTRTIFLIKKSAAK